MTPAKIKDGLESIKDYNANGMMAPVTVTAQDHGGGGKTRIEMWDGSKWVPQTELISAAFKDEVWGVVKALGRVRQVRKPEIDRARQLHPAIKPRTGGAGFPGTTD